MDGKKAIKHFKEKTKRKKIFLLIHHVLNPLPKKEKERKNTVSERERVRRLKEISFFFREGIVVSCHKKFFRNLISSYLISTVSVLWLSCMAIIHTFTVQGVRKDENYLFLMQMELP